MEPREVDILLVEDNSADAELTVRALKKSNSLNNIMRVKDGAEALEYIFCIGRYADRNFELKPKVILLDLNMPKISGIDVLRRIKADEQTKIIPVIVLTSSRESPDVKACYELGANSFIVKPVGFENFIHAVAELGLYWTLLNLPPA
ncbi:MAG TPA: response regulator [Bacteroidia bacterium]|nr:response regulator [Bacteroidia bacterium]